ncbi:MAG: thymidine phosphorylase [Candidatus Gastranaerophilales bacterium]|nr:thymidine phosphorylase [Candidatus Gastranaerophilales bacterium]
MRAIDIIYKKKRGEAHTREELEFWVKGICDGTIPDYQLTAWLMLVCMNGMNFEETAILTELFAKSGTILDLSDIADYILDKHSTGGVGDKISLILIPLMAACGGKIAKLSGRGLGHTGGTIDKLESISGFNTGLSIDEFKKQVKDIGCALASQTTDLAYADKKFYELRDVTGAVDCLPLIASSIISKKVASGANVIVLDVKCGDGAIVKTKAEAEELSNLMVEVAKRLNRSITAVISSMEEPLGHNIGNSLEIIESVEVLKGRGPKDLVDLTFELGAVLLTKSHIAENKEAAIELMKQRIKDGSALEKFRELIKCQNGDDSCIDDYSKLPQASIIKPYVAQKSGYLKRIKALEIALACKLLGAGREKKTDEIDYSVGIILNKKVGEKIEAGEKLLDICANDESKIALAENMLKNAFEIVEEPTKPEPLIYKIIG